MKWRYAVRAGVGMAAMMAAAVTQAQPTEYRIDLGVGLSGLQIPHYPGADEKDGYLLPFPFVRVKGPRFEIERNELSGALFKSGRFRIGLTMGGSVPVNSEDNTARKGMPDLDIGIEGGPSFSYALWMPSIYHKLSFDVPVRKAVFFNSEKIDPQGGFAIPHFHYLYEVLDGERNSHAVEIELGAEYASADYHRYFYSVAPDYATPERPAYEAKGGLSAYRFTIGFSRTRDSWYYGAFAKYLDLSDSAVAGSPLVKQDQTLYAGVAVAYLFDRFSLWF